MDKQSIEKKSVGVVGLGFMGCSIVTALLVKGQHVVALAPMARDLEQAPGQIESALKACLRESLTAEPPEEHLRRLVITSNYQSLANCWIVIETVVENVEIKKEVFTLVEAVVSDEVILTSNTSAIPISTLQSFVQKPHRLFGMHWAEPAYTSSFLEIICGEQSSTLLGERLRSTAVAWGKEPTLVRKDIRGFITNRIMYAMYREAFYLVENGYATIEDVDRACKNDGGHWMSFCGLFRYMDLTGLQAYHAVMKDLFPTLNNQNHVPKLIKDIAERGGNGTSNGRGFYTYSPEEAKAWDEAFSKFSFDIHRLSLKYQDIFSLERNTHQDD